MGRLLFTYRSHIGTVNAISWSPDGTYIASGSSDRTVRAWYVQSGADARSYSRHTDSVNAVTWSPDTHAQYVASGGNDKMVHVWKAVDASEMLIYDQHSDIVRATAWSPDGKYIASASADHTVQVWPAPQAGDAPKDPTNSGITPIVTFTGHSDTVNTVAWSPNGTVNAVYAVMWSPADMDLASAGADKTVQLWYCYRS
jgi:WD40 repeat protein